ncbi:DUF1934 domain-containing protein [Butyrivibrio sp. INlla16]|uniref:DUF1934 domain-containing protein n=1 Tax=Butyrivibrio sp. INlla16 TaxID=1520807 RepID=UPI0008881B60|nr:DUF1934 domain-containing protein [Butyrivibrio sp. INlla16]SDB64907.1 Uncharacterized beta-barrel protein YwiB, DUF1934 family [Butyrivibrio sp. INlla16]
MNGTLKIVGSHDHGDGTPEIIKQEFPASCDQQGTTYIITYTEDMSDTPGEAPAVTSHRLEIGEGFLRMVQTGALDSELYFSLGKTWNTDYKTPYGLMKMTAITRHLMIEENPKKITAHVQYELQLDGDKISDSKVRISFTPDNM